MRRLASVSVWVREDSDLQEESFVRACGEPWAWLYLGEDRELAVYGSPAAMRRLAAAVIAAAAAAEELPDKRLAADVALTVVAEP